MHTDEEIILMDYVSQSLQAEDQGSVHEMGYFALVEVGDPAEQLSVTNLEPGDFLTPGWYIYKEDDLGNVWGFPFDSQELAEDAWSSVEFAYEQFYLEGEG